MKSLFSALYTVQCCMEERLHHAARQDREATQLLDSILELSKGMQAIGRAMLTHHWCRGHGLVKRPSRYPCSSSTRLSNVILTTFCVFTVGQGFAINLLARSAWGRQPSFA